jgi:hypothetical protein
LAGHGIDQDGVIVGYLWRSSIDGAIGTAATLDLSTLSNGTHTIYFSALDDSGAWSTETITVLTVQPPVADDPLYQKMQDLDALVGDLQQQNTALALKIDQAYVALLGLGIVTVILVLALIAVVFMKKHPPSTGVATPPPA